MNFILFAEVSRSKPMLKLNEILNQALWIDKKEEIDIHSRTRPTILLYLFIASKVKIVRNYANFRIYSHKFDMTTDF